ncbi:MAG: gamma carbonic anhydrase family protein [Planctomycetota bacterium]|jgi:carbonic anhydrase/acetyltransferase-like protein (isoleucine patch superfamily)|tara:strand:- start:304 stop:828 length:525 start_codon:yes stop_codon:yes gene_type:complete
MSDTQQFPTPRKGLLRRVAGGAMVAEGAVVTGKVHLAQDVSIWFGVIIRGDDAEITIGERTNVQDGVIIHCDSGINQSIGKNCTIGHRAVLHGVSIGDNVLIGMSATVLGGSTIGDGAVIAAGCVVRQGFDVPPNTLVAGVPAKIIREVSAAERAFMVHSVPHYIETAETYLSE